MAKPQDSSMETPWKSSEIILSNYFLSESAVSIVCVRFFLLRFSRAVWFACADYIRLSQFSKANLRKIKFISNKTTAVDCITIAYRERKKNGTPN